jgi:hypothetical protein
MGGGQLKEDEAIRNPLSHRSAILSAKTGGENKKKPKKERKAG